MGVGSQEENRLNRSASSILEDGARNGYGSRRIIFYAPLASAGIRAKAASGRTHGSMSVIGIYRQLPRNATASTRTKKRKNTPIKRGTHQIELSYTSRLGWAVLAHPRTPSGYNSAQRPTAPKQKSVNGNIHRVGATK